MGKKGPKLPKNRAQELRLRETDGDPDSYGFSLDDK